MSEHADSLLAFIDASPTPYHAATQMAACLKEAGFVELQEGDAWTLESGGRYFVLRNQSSLLAFCYGDGSPAEQGIRMVGAHTDSPCLKLKPAPDALKGGIHSLGVEVYGGALLNPWFDRDLSLAGRVHYRRAGTLCDALVDFEAPVAVIPSLAIHLDREVNQKRSINPQTDILPMIQGVEDNSEESFVRLLAAQLEARHGIADADILDFEILCYDTQPAARTGLNREWISAARLDNLLSCYVGLQALLDATPGQHRLLICNDHEEVGSVSAAGAQGNFLLSFLQRLCGDAEDYARCLNRSLLVSTDNAHAVHPNYRDRHDPRHLPMLNGGPVLKVNANQRYASNSETQARFRLACEEAGVSLQQFVARTDMGCGSTIGPLTAAQTGVRTLDVGVPTLGMHSCRELAGAADVDALYRALKAVYSLPAL